MAHRISLPCVMFHNWSPYVIFIGFFCYTMLIFTKFIPWQYFQFNSLYLLYIDSYNSISDIFTKTIYTLATKYNKIIHKFVILHINYSKSLDTCTYTHILLYEIKYHLNTILIIFIAYLLTLIYNLWCDLI